MREQYLAQQINGLTETKKDLFKLITYDKLSQSCQNFIQNVFNVGDVNFNPKKKFYNIALAKFGIMLGINLDQIFLDVYRFDIDLSCYNKHPNFANIVQQLQVVHQHLIMVKNYFRHVLQKRGYVNKI